MGMWSLLVLECCLTVGPPVAFIIPTGILALRLVLRLDLKLNLKNNQH